MVTLQKCNKNSTNLTKRNSSEKIEGKARSINSCKSPPQSLSALLNLTINCCYIIVFLAVRYPTIPPLDHVSASIRSVSHQPICLSFHRAFNTIPQTCHPSTFSRRPNYGCLKRRLWRFIYDRSRGNVDERSRRKSVDIRLPDWHGLAACFFVL